jgi:septal ring factor EnvC (AmiA/AmiB activator)
MTRSKGAGASSDTTAARPPDVLAPLPAGYEPSHVIQMLVQNQKDLASLGTKIDRMIDDVKDQTARMTATEVCMAKIETRLEHIQSEIHETKTDLKKYRDTAQLDFRILFGALITATLGLGAIVAHGLHWF